MRLRHHSHVFLWFIRLLSFAYVTASVFFPKAQAQSLIVPDDTLGAERSQFLPLGPTNEIITGGAVRGQNLFHSFEEFNVDVGKFTFFQQSPTIQSIFSRVTGDNPSVILGTLGTSLFGGNVDLYFINPNGVLFGPNSSILVAGSFLATTADSVVFGEQGSFSAADTNPVSAALTVNPSAFLFNQTPVASIELSQANLTLLFSNQNLAFLGGDIALDNSTILSLDGGVALQTVAEPGTVAFDADSFALTVPDSIRRANISLDNQSLITLAAGEGISLQGETIALSNGSELLSIATFPFQGDGGAIEIMAESIALESNSSITSVTQGDGEGGPIGITADSLNLSDSSFILSNAFAQGNAGNIEIQVSSLDVSNGSQIDASTFGLGDTGRIVINAIGAVNLTGRSATNFPSAIFSGVEPGAMGNSRGIEIMANSLRVTERAQISSTTESNGDAGSIVITTTGDVLLQNSIIISEISEFSGNGTGGDITINANALQVLDGSALLADTENIGNAGNITINASDRVVLAGRGPSAGNINNIVPSQITTTVEALAIGEGGDIGITTGILLLTDSAFISSSTFGQGSAGDIEIQVNALNATDGAQIGAFTQSAQSAGEISVTANDTVLLSGQDDNGPTEITSASLGNAQGNGGPIVIVVPDLTLVDQARITAISEGTGIAGSIDFTTENLQVFNGSIETNASQSSGGDIRVNAQTDQRSGIITLRGDGDITTDSLGDGGNITLNSIVVALDDSDILARSADARGGNITFGTLFSNTLPVGAILPPDGNGRVDISADGRLASGVISTPDTSFVENSLTQLPETIINPNTLVAGSCIAQQNNTDGSFVISPSDGLPPQPNRPSQTTFSTGDVGNVSVMAEASTDWWNPGDPIVEPAEIYQLTDGRLILGQACG
ncbi:MAG: filamentous hemagglutinin N-terminal domain-containing protein [Leptolyngbya sp. SIO3F4]|nr:filamentous hemagglutinin N-terminal domain-containing protein [Leptolyngbya sp. SIO3F4]